MKELMTSEKWKKFGSILHENPDNINGYIYCVFNEVYLNYGGDCYKLGTSTKVGKRISCYSTYYVNPIELKIKNFLIVRLM